jgi:hypothetical protein
LSSRLKPVLQRASNAHRRTGFSREASSSATTFGFLNTNTFPNITNTSPINNLRSALLGEKPQNLVNPQVWKG